MKLQEERGSKRPLGLVQDVQTRWNSQLFMIERLVLLYDVLTSVIHGGIYEGKVVLPEKERSAVWPTEHQWKVGLSLVSRQSKSCYALLLASWFDCIDFIILMSTIFWSCPYRCSVMWLRS